VSAPTSGVLEMLDPRSADVLERLYAEAESQPPPDVPVDAEDAHDEALVAAQIRAFDDQFLSLDRDQAAFCYLQARAHVREAGLEPYVDIRVGDALQTLRGLDGPVDLLLNDGFPDAALGVHRLVAPAMRPGALVITDNVGLMPDEYAPYLAWLRDPANGFISVPVPFHGGTEMSVRTAEHAPPR
jgi:predicted O-methyltransferase YrrM